MHKINTHIYIYVILVLGYRYEKINFDIFDPGHLVFFIII